MTNIIVHPSSKPEATLADLCGTGIQATPVTMTSLEIAVLTGKQHKNVVRDVRKMLAELGLEGGSDLSQLPEKVAPKFGFFI